MKYLVIALLLVSLVLFGCTGNKAQKIPQYTCHDGTVVSDPSDCPSKQTTQPTQTSVSNAPEADEELSDQCLTLHESQLDTYILTDEGSDCYVNKYVYLAIDGNIGYIECNEIILSHVKASCYGAYAGHLGDTSKCSQFTESSEKDRCLFWNAISISYNGKGPVSSQLCDGITEETAREECLELITPYFPCQNSDTICPDACNYLIDNDCPTYPLGQKATASNGLDITITGPGEVRHCYTAYSSEISSYGHYYVLSITVTNTGTGAEYLYKDFILVDSDGIQHEFDSFVGGDTCEDASEFESGELYPGSTSNGELWFELGDDTSLPPGEQKILYDPNMHVNGDDVVFVFNG